MSRDVAGMAKLCLKSYNTFILFFGHKSELFKNLWLWKGLQLYFGERLIEYGEQKDL